MSLQSDLVQINRGLEQYARTFSADSAEYADLEFQLSRLLGYPQIDKEELGRRFSRSKQYSYNADALTLAKALVQGSNTAAAQAQAYYMALQEAGAEISSKSVKLLAKNISWIREKQSEIYNLLSKEYGDDWQDSDTRKAFFNAYDNSPDSLYAVFARDAEYRKDHGDDAADFIKNIDRIRAKLELSENKYKEYARQRREETRRSRRYTAAEVKQMFSENFL